MKSILLFIICITLGACNLGTQTPEEAYRDKMKNATDEELMSDIIGKPLNYKVVDIVIREIPKGGSLNNVISNGEVNQYEKLGIRSGAVLQATFTNGSVYIDKFGRLNGEYNAGTYADKDGSVTLSFGDSPVVLSTGNDSAIGQEIYRYDEGRNNPVRNCQSLGIHYIYNSSDGFSDRKMDVHYYLESLTRPGYFKPESSK